MRPKSFPIIFIAYFYTMDIPTMGSHRDNMCFMSTQLTVIVLDSTISFSLWWTMEKMVIFTQKCEQRWVKINKREGGGRGGGVGIKMSWVEKNRKINQGGTIIRDSRVCSKEKCFNSSANIRKFK